MKEPLTVHISKKQFDYLVERDRFLTALEAAGVDNWEGYRFAAEEATCIVCGMFESECECES